MKIRVAVDAMGGDRAPEEIVAGALAARSDTVEPVLFGRREILEPLAEGLGIVHADDIVAMDEKPSDAARDAQALDARCRRVPAVPSAEAASSRLPDLRDVPRS